jgi:hypothetical protein
MSSSNLSNLSLNAFANLTSNPYSLTYPSECLNEGRYSIECLQAVLCPQFDSYFINVGITIIIAYIALSWLLWWYLKHGYKWFPVPINKFWGDITQLDTRLYWDTWFRARIAKVMLGYIAVVVWLAINRKI